MNVSNLHYSSAQIEELQLHFENVETSDREFTILLNKVVRKTTIKGRKHSNKDSIRGLDRYCD